MTGMTPEDLAALQGAVQSLEHPGLAARLTNMVGKPIELIGRVLPAAAAQAIAAATSKGLEVALKVALRTMQRSPHAGSQLLHKALVLLSQNAAGDGLENPIVEAIHEPAWGLRWAWLMTVDRGSTPMSRGL